MKMMSARDKKKDYLVPRLRFPEFRDTGEWGKVQLSKIAIPVSERATDGDADAVLTLSAEHGVVTQGSYFGKKIAGDDVTRYIKIKNNDFVYNDRTTKFYKYGTIKRLSRHTYGIVSPIYKCFRFNDEEIPVFWEWYFESGEHDTQLHNIVNEGAKAGRFNISIQKFLSIFVYFPDKSEQQRIADCLSSLDERIAAETTKLDRLKDHKNGLLKQLFPAEGETLPQLRFPEFRDGEGWQKRFLDEYAEVVRGGSPRPIDNFLTTERDGLNWLKIGDINKEAKYVVATMEKVRAEALSKTREINPGDLILSNSMSFGRPYISKIKACIHDGWIAIKKISKKLYVEYIYYLISSPFSQQYFTSNAAGSGVQNLNADIIKSLPILFPNILEQQRIADCLSSLDALIASQTQKIDLLKDHKKGLMQQLFPCIDEVRA